MKIHEYNEMMAHLTRPATNRNIGGGTIQGQDMGYRTGFVDPNLIRRQESIQSYYDIFGKELLDKISKKKHGKVFSKLEGSQLSNLKRFTLTKYKDFILKNKRAPTEFEARSFGWSASRTLTDQGIQIRLVEDLKSGSVDINELAKKYKISVEELKQNAAQLERNVWKKRAGTSPLKWLTNDDNVLSPLLKKLYKSKLVVYQKDKIQELFFEAFGNSKNKKTYNPSKYKAMKKNWSEYNKLRNSIQEIFPGIKFQLDHPLSKDTLRTIFKASGDQLTRVNPMIAELNNGLKKSLSMQYQKNLKNLPAKKAIEKIARDLGINIGSVSDDIKKYNFKVNQFQNLNMGDELVKAVEQQANLAKNLPNYVKNNPELFKTAEIDTKTIKPVTSIKSSVINKIKTLIGNADIGIQSTDTQKTILSKINKAPIPKKAKVALLGVVGGVAAITGADLMTGTAQAADGAEVGSMLPAAAVAAPFFSKASGAAAKGLGVESKVAQNIADPLKYLRKGARKAASSILSPLGAGAIWGATGGVDLESGIDRAGLGAEAAFSKELVKHSDKLTKPIQNQAMRSIVRGVLNAGMPLKWAMRAARVASPIGWATLGAEGIYQLGKYAIKEHKKIKAMEPEEKKEHFADVEKAHALDEDIAATRGYDQGGRVGLVQGTSLPPVYDSRITGADPTEKLPFSQFFINYIMDQNEKGYITENDVEDLISGKDEKGMDSILLEYQKINPETGTQWSIGAKPFGEEKQIGFSFSKQFNQGGRVGYAEGPKDPKRRLVLKGIGALAMLPIVGRFFKTGKLLEKAGAYTGPVIEKIKGMPEWLPSLVKRLWNEGEDVTKTAATMERQVVKRGTLESGDDVDLIYDVGTGNVSVNVTPIKGREYSAKKTESGAFNQEYGLELTKGEEIATKKGSIKTKDEFKVVETEPVRTGHPEDPDWDWDWSQTTVDDAITDLTELEAFAKNKSTKQIYKKKGTKKKDVNPEVEYDDTYDLDYDID